MERSAPGAAGDDPTCEAIKEELRDLSARVGDRAEYEKTGRACLLAGMSSHAQQRASGMDVQSTSKGKASAYLTPKMEEMVEVSRESSGSAKRGGCSTGKQTGQGRTTVRKGRIRIEPAAKGPQSKLAQVFDYLCSVCVGL